MRHFFKCVHSCVCVFGGGIYVGACACVRARVHACAHVCVHVCAREHARMCVCACMCVCVCVCVCVWCGVKQRQHSIKQGSIDFLPTVFTAKYAQYFSVFISLFLSPVSQNQPALV